MHKLTAANVNAHMRGAAVGKVGIEEEDQIAHGQVVPADRAAVVHLRRSAVRQTIAEVLIYIHGEAGAVETAGRGAAIDIRHAAEAQRKVGNIGACTGSLTGRLSAGEGRGTAAGGI